MKKWVKNWFWVFALFLALAEYAPAQSFSPEEAHSRLVGGISLYSQGKWAEAVLELRSVLAEAPSRELQGEALFWISLSELSAGEYGQALRNMDALEKMHPEIPRLRELPYHRGRALYYLGRYDEAIVLLKGYADSFMPEPGSALNSADASQKAAALYWTGECLFSMGHLDKAEEIFSLIAEEYPWSPKYEASRYRIDLINQKKVETELLSLLRWSHEESLRNMEEFRRRESAYDQALAAYQRRIADMPLGELIARIDSYISSGTTVTEEELTAVESALNRLKAMYRPGNTLR